MTPVVKIAYVFVLALLMGLSGCQTMALFFDNKQDTLSPQPVMSDENVKLLEQRVKRDFEEVDGPTTRPTMTKTLRDQVVDDQIRLADAYYLRYERELARGRATTDLVLDLTNLFFSGAATVTGGEQAKTVLSGIATLVAGAKLAVDENLFFKQTSPALTAKMRAGRLTKLGEIRTKQLKSLPRYSFAEAEHDVLDYYSAGTVYGAVADIIEKSQDEEKQAKATLDKASTQPSE